MTTVEEEEYFIHLVVSGTNKRQNIGTVRDIHDAQYSLFRETVLNVL